MLKFTIEQLNELTDNEKLLIINFSLLANYSYIENEALYNCYIENVDLLQVAKGKLKLSDMGELTSLAFIANRASNLLLV